MQNQAEIIALLVDALGFCIPIGIFWALGNHIVSTMISWISGGNKSV